MAVVLLFLFNVSAFNQQVFNSGTGVTASPFSLWGSIFDKLFSNAQGAAIQQVLLFGLWGVVGALVYILAFRCLQFFIKAQGSVRQGASLVYTERSRGILRYFESLHDFFVKLIIILLGTMAILTGAVVCFGIASQQLNKGLDQSFPDDLLPFLVSLFGALLAVRLIVIGTSLLSPRFRIWYNA